jgi:hypothetical protein
MKVTARVVLINSFGRNLELVLPPKDTASLKYIEIGGTFFRGFRLFHGFRLTEVDNEFKCRYNRAEVSGRVLNMCA